MKKSIFALLLFIGCSKDTTVLKSNSTDESVMASASINSVCGAGNAWIVNVSLDSYDGKFWVVYATEGSIVYSFMRIYNGNSYQYLLSSGCPISNDCDRAIYVIKGIKPIKGTAVNGKELATWMCPQCADCN